jgi:hypothetical protein
MSDAPGNLLAPELEHIPGTARSSSRPPYCGEPSQPARNPTRSGGLSGWDLIDEDVAVAGEKKVTDFKGLTGVVIQGAEKANNRDTGAKCEPACLAWRGHSEGELLGKVVQFVAET